MQTICSILESTNSFFLFMITLSVIHIKRGYQKRKKTRFSIPVGAHILNISTLINSQNFFHIMCYIHNFSTFFDYCLLIHLKDDLTPHKTQNTKRQSAHAHKQSGPMRNVSQKALLLQCIYINK